MQIGLVTLSYIPINSQSAARGEGLKWLSVRATQNLPETIFYIVIKTILRNAFKLQALLN